MRRRRLLITGAAAVIVAGVVFAGVTLISPDAPAPSPPAQPSAPTSAALSACGLPGSAGADAPGAVTATWTLVGAYSLPVSATDGPGVQVPAGPWSCFTHTPSGAVLAGITIGMRANGVAENWQDVARAQTMPGPGQDALLAKPLPDAEVVTVRGFSIAGYSDQRATIRYYLHSSSADASCTTDVQWSNDDWRLVLTDNGSTSSGCALGAPADFTPWGPT